MLGIPCFTADRAAIDSLQAAIEQASEVAVEARVDTGTITAGTLKVAAGLPQAVRDAFLSGQWNPTAMLLAEFDAVRAVASRLPYISGF
jgi:3-isopropylmalate/(R)-2-methylmalate dehydratase small subunit